MTIIKSLDTGKNPPEKVNVFIEANQDGRNYYKLEKNGLVRLVDCLDGNFTLPKDFGAIPKTYHSNMESLEAFVLSRESPEIGSIVNIKPIGTIKYVLDELSHEHIIGVVEQDERYNKADDIEDLSEKHTEEVTQFLKEIAHIKNKNIKIKGWFGKDRAKKLINHSMRLYKRKFED